MSIMKELDILNQEITSATRELDQAKGKKEAKIETLKKEFGISPDKVPETIDKLVNQLGKLSDEIEAKFTKLKEEYEW